MLFHVDMIYLAKQPKRDVKKIFALRCEPWPNRTQNEISSVLFQNEESMQMFCQFSSGQEHFTHGMLMTALIRPSDVKN